MDTFFHSEKTAVSRSFSDLLSKDIEDEDDIDDEEEPDQEDDEGQDEETEEDSQIRDDTEEQEEHSVVEEVITEGDDEIIGSEGDEEIATGRENSPTTSRLMKRRENKYKFSKKLMSYLLVQYCDKERKINGINGKFMRQDLQEIRRLVRIIHGEEIDSMVYKQVFGRIKLQNEKKAKTKASFIVPLYLDILKEEEEKEKEILFLKRFKKEISDYTEVRDVSEESMCVKYVEERKLYQFLFK